MAVSEADFQQAMSATQSQMQSLERGLTARIALAEAEVLRLRSARDEGTKSGKSGILDSRKIYPQPLKDMGRWKPWSERVIRWARMQSPELYAALSEALKTRDRPVVHECGGESVFFWAHRRTGSQTLRRCRLSSMCGTTTELKHFVSSTAATTPSRL